MYYNLLKVCAGLIVCFVLTECELAVEKGGYTNVVVAFAQNVPSDKADEFLDNFKTVLKNASGVLQGAIGIRFSKVTIVLSWNRTGSSQTNIQPHILVEAVNGTVFGKFPFAHQYGPCGTPGSHLTIPTEFLTDTSEIDFPKGTILAREWLKYRYGVFDENGFPNDEIYPSYYSIPGTDPKEIKVTDCTNIPVEYNIVQEDGQNCSRIDELTNLPDANQCKPVPNEETDAVKSSLMFFQEEFKSMSHVCGKDTEHEHASLSPNKHNALCHGRSIWGVLQNSSDFINLETSTGDNEIEYDYVQEPYPRIVIVWDNTKKMLPQGKRMFDAVRRFFHDLPDGSKCAFIPFTDAPFGDISLRELTEWPKNREISYASSFGADKEGCVNCAVTKALDMLSDGETPLEGTIVAMVRSSLASSDELLKRIANTKVCLVFYVFNKDVLEEYTGYAEGTDRCVKVRDFTSVEEKEVFNEVYDKLKAEIVLPEIINERITETKSAEYMKINSSIITVPVDSTAEKVMFWIFYDLEPNSVILKFNGQDVKAEQEFRDKDQFVGCSYSLQKEQQPGKLDFMTEYPKDVTILTQVSVTSKRGEYCTVDIFIHNTTEPESDVQMPVIIYASVRLGAYPVQYAEVEATVWQPDGDKLTLIMYDDGKGDPDITKGDGIYSRYFTAFTKAGNYPVEVNVKNVGDTTRAGKFFSNNNKQGFQTCCGSSVRIGSLPLSSLSKKVTSSFWAKSGRPEGGYKPSRVADLKVDKADGDKVVLKWTAPGAEADEGTVENYEIKYFTSREDADNNFDDKGMLLNIAPSNPVSRGSAVKLEINTGDFEQSGTCYIAIRAKSESGKIGDISNIVEVFVPDSGGTTTDKETDGGNTGNEKVAATDKKIVGIIIGVILAVVVLIIIIYLAIYFIVLKPKRKEEVKRREDTERKMKNSSTENRAEKPSSDTNVNSINYIPASAIIKNHTEIQRAKAEKKRPPIFREEDFGDKNSTATGSDFSGDHNEEEPGYSQVQKNPKNEEPVPPKSPKRTTCV